MSVGLLEGMSSAIAESDNRAGGLVLTRTTAAVALNEVTLGIWTWDGTTLVLTDNTLSVAVGDWIQYAPGYPAFKIASIVPMISVIIENPDSLAIPSAPGLTYRIITDIPVETTSGWGASGIVAVGGSKLTYGSKTLDPPSLNEITHLSGGLVTPGPRKLIPIQTSVLDMSADRSGLEQVRQGVLVDYAVGDQLNALARNLGVNRKPATGSDDLFRAVVKALAYNPRGTVYGLELLLDELVGAGNYEIYEDLVNNPAEVFIRFTGASLVSDVSTGKAYVQGEEVIQLATPTTGTLANEVVTDGIVSSMLYLPVAHRHDVRTVYPSTISVDDIVGTRTPWDVQNGVEGVDVNNNINVNDGEYLEFENTAVATHYEYSDCRITPEAGFHISSRFRPNTELPASPNIFGGLIIDDGAFEIGVCVYGTGVVAGDIDAFYAFGNFQGSSVIGSAKQVTYALATDHDYPLIEVIRKAGESTVQLFVNHELVSTRSVADFPASTGRRVAFGKFINDAQALRWRDIAVHIMDPTDYWSIRDTDGSLVATIDQIDTVGSNFVAGDVGKTLITRNSATGKNNGSWLIDGYVSATRVTLTGETFPNAQVAAANPVRVTVPANGPKFRYPQDIGKKIQISGSALGNDGEWTIATMLDPNSLTDLSLLATPLPTETNVVELFGPAFSTESGLTWQLNPDFANDVGLEWEMAGAGLAVATALTLRNAIGITDVGFAHVVMVQYTQVLTAQVLLDNTIDNNLIQSTPTVLFDYYPFYVSDPLGLVKAYADEILAAGVIPTYEELT